MPVTINNVSEELRIERELENYYSDFLSFMTYCDECDISICEDEKNFWGYLKIHTSKDDYPKLINRFNELTKDYL